MKERYVVVIGGTNCDIGGFSSAEILMGDSNPGSVEMCAGGVGHNIAMNLASMGVPVKMITALGDDSFGELLQDEMKDKLDLSYSIIQSNSRSGIYLFISDDHGEMRLAVNDMSILEGISSDYIERNIEILNQAEFVIIEANIPVQTIDTIVRLCTRPIIADAVSCKKVCKLNGALSKLKILKPNMEELEVLSDITITDYSSFRCACDRMFEKGVSSMIVSLGKKGAVFCSPDRMFHCPVLPGVDIVNTTGAGDSLMAGFGYGLFLGEDVQTSARYAVAAAQICTMSSSTVSENMSGDLVISIAEEIVIDEELSGLFK
jgi:pseudouridine kinase